MRWRRLPALLPLMKMLLLLPLLVQSG